MKGKEKGTGLSINLMLAYLLHLTVVRDDKMNRGRGRGRVGCLAKTQIFSMLVKSSEFVECPWHKMPNEVEARNFTQCELTSSSSCFPSPLYPLSLPSVSLSLALLLQTHVIVNDGG